MAEGRFMPLRVLHISDLHERAPFKGMPAVRKAMLDWDARERGLILGNKFYDGLREVAQAGIDLVCLTGDVADWGRPEEYYEASHRLKLILDAVQIPPSRFFVVPGNHDIQRSVHSEAWEGIRKWYGKTHDGSALGRWFLSVGEAPPGIVPEWRDQILEREAAFWQWTKDFGCADIQPCPSVPLGYRRTFAIGTWPHVTVPVQVVGLDSAWLCGDDNDQGKIIITGEQALAHVRDGQNALTGFRIALLHHPLFEVADQHEVWGLLADGVDLLLHGHQHRPLAADVAVPGASLRILAAGCLIEGDVGKNWPNGYQLIEVDVASRACSIHLRKWARDASPGFWTKGSDIYPGAPDGVLTWPEPGNGTGVPSHGDERSCADYAKAIRPVFSRAAFDVGLWSGRHGGSAAMWRDALMATRRALTTGIWTDREGHLIDKVPSIDKCPQSTQRLMYAVEKALAYCVAALEVEASYWEKKVPPQSNTPKANLDWVGDLGLDLLHANSETEPYSIEAVIAAVNTRLNEKVFLPSGVPGLDSTVGPLSTSEVEDLRRMVETTPRAEDPHSWAIYKRVLGSALRQRGDLQGAIAAYEDSLTFFEKEDAGSAGVLCRRLGLLFSRIDPSRVRHFLLRAREYFLTKGFVNDVAWTDRLLATQNEELTRICEM